MLDLIFAFVLALLPQKVQWVIAGTMVFAVVALVLAWQLHR